MQLVAKCVELYTSALSCFEGFLNSFIGDGWGGVGGLIWLLPLSFDVGPKVKAENDLKSASVLGVVIPALSQLHVKQHNYDSDF